MIYFTLQHRYRKFSFETCLMICPGEKWVEQSSWWTEVQPIPYNLGFFKLRQQEKGTKFYGVSDVCPLAERMSRGRKKRLVRHRGPRIHPRIYPSNQSEMARVEKLEGHKRKKTIHFSRFLSFTNYFHSLSILILSVLQ